MQEDGITEGTGYGGGRGQYPNLSIISLTAVFSAVPTKTQDDLLSSPQPKRQRKRQVSCESKCMHNKHCIYCKANILNQMCCDIPHAASASY